MAALSEYESDDWGVLFRYKLRRQIFAGSNHSFVISEYVKKSLVEIVGGHVGICEMQLDATDPDIHIASYSIVLPISFSESVARATVEKHPRTIYFTFYLP